MGQKIKNSFCSLPNVHVFVQPQGVKPCCSYNSISTQPIQTFWTSTELNTISADTLGCKTCQRQEAATGQSTRLESNSDWADWDKQSTPVYLDLRISNLCNYSCRSCEPDFSSVIDQELKTHPELKKFYRGSDQKIQYVDQHNLDYVLSILPTLKQLRFAGGEPTHQPEVKKIIQHIIQNKLDHIDIQITTNGSFRDHFWQEVIAQLPRIHWTLSLDGVGEVAELVRKGTNWARVEHNLHFLAAHAHSLLINTTVSNLNILHLTPLIKLVNSARARNSHKRNGCDHMFQPVSNPAHMSPWVLPPELRVVAQEKCQEYQKLSPENADLFQRIYTGMTTVPYDSAMWQRSCEFNQTLDSIRGEDYANVLFP
jgi:pyruvate-formate lyase-activating enzyme